MEPTQTFTAAPLHSQWVDLSEKHKQARERLELAIRKFKDRQAVSVKNIVGVYGSGKTMLMAYGFRFAWTECRIPALLVNLENLLAWMPSEPMGPSEFSEKLGEYVNCQLQMLIDNLEVSPRTETVALANDLKADETVLGYMRTLFGRPDLESSEVKSILEQGRAVVFIDEIEQMYQELPRRIQTSDGSPLRDTLEKVEQGTVPYYLVLSFALSSAYEATRGADARRWDIISVPLPDPIELKAFVKNEQLTNLAWWASRGTPGFALSLSQSWLADFERVKSFEYLFELQPSQFEGMPILEKSGLDQKFNDVANRSLLELIKHIGPVVITDIGVDRFQREKAEEFWPKHFTLIGRSHDRLVKVADFRDGFLNDLRRIASTVSLPDVDYIMIAYYLNKILMALSDKDERMCLGGYPKTECFAEGVVLPILSLLQDIILEFSNEQSTAPVAVTLIDRTFDLCKVGAEGHGDAFQVSRNFPNTYALFDEVSPVDECIYISLSPLAVVSLFPRMVGRPLMTLVSLTKSTIKEQTDVLQGHVGGKKEYLKFEYHLDDFQAQVIFYLGGVNVPGIQDCFLSRVQRQSYLKQGKVTLLVDLCQETDSPEGLRRDLNGDIRILEDLFKLQWANLDEKRSMDFIISLWHNWVALGLDDSKDLFGVIDYFLNMPGLTKSNRRKLEYYRKKLLEKLENISKQAIGKHRKKMLTLFDHDDPDFPEKRIRDTMRGIKDNRAIEYMSIAYDAFVKPENTLDVLGSLRELELLTETTENPHAYTTFLKNYSATGGKKGKGYRASEALEEIRQYISKRFTSIQELIRVAERLGLDNFFDGEDTKQSTEYAPLLYLFEKCSEEKKTFIRGLSLQTFIGKNREAMIDRIENQLELVDRLTLNIEAIITQEKKLNQELAKPVLSSKDLEDYVSSLNKYRQILDRRQILPPGVLYIMYRFTDAMVKSLDENRQRWDGDKGLAYWRNKLHPVLGWQQRLDATKEEISQAFENYRNLKEQIVASPSVISKEVYKRIQQAATEIFNQLDANSRITDGRLPSIDTGLFLEAEAAAYSRKDEIIEQTEQVDDMVDRLQNLHLDISEMINRLGE